jgi:hypothetical protein
MGRYAECWLGPFYVGSTKNGFEPDLIQLFRSTEKVATIVKKHHLPYQMRRWATQMDADEVDVPVLFYHAPISIVRDRLELRGYTTDLAKALFTKSLSAEASNAASYRGTPYWELYEPTVRALEGVDVEQWLGALRFIKNQTLLPRDLGGSSAEHKGTLVGYMLEQDWYGYPGPDINVALRVALEVCSENDELIYDLTDLLDEYVQAEEDLVSSALTESVSDYLYRGKIIVLTEGVSDGWIISESLRLLYPHLSDYFTFMDFEGARVAGGAGSLANIVKAFAGAGIVNRILAIFDNDTAGEIAIRSLRNVRLPGNIRILKLPEIAALREYPTIGPSGQGLMDVNGIAGCIELYLGSDVLRDEEGRTSPVQWTGYEPSAGKYQGEVLFKGKIQERFKKKVESCRANPQIFNKEEWCGLDAILTAMLAAFHQQDKEQISSFVSGYHNHEISDDSSL